MSSGVLASWAAWVGEVGVPGEEGAFSISQTLGVSQQQFLTSCVSSCRVWCGTAGGGERGYPAHPVAARTMSGRSPWRESDADGIGQPGSSRAKGC